MSSNKPEAVLIIDDDIINKAIAAIEATEPTPEERESAQLAKLIPFIRTARARGESDDKIRKKIRSAIPKLHYTKMDALLATAAKPASDQQGQADQVDKLLGGAQ